MAHEQFVRFWQRVRQQTRQIYQVCRREVRRLDPRRYTGWRQYACLAAIGLILGTLTAPVVGYMIEQQRYVLAADAQKLVGAPNPNLTAKITYDSKADQYVFNQSGKRTGDTSPAEALRAQAGGNGKNDVSLYSANLPTDLSKGLTVYDNNLEVSFTMTPLFTSDGGKLKNGRLVYPLPYGQAVYTAKSNGIKEDILLDHSPGKNLSLNYKLDLPDSLQARMLPDGSLGIYSADPSLYGNISFGSDADQAQVEVARRNGQKNHLVFGLPAPIISQSGLKAGHAKASFKLAGDNLTVFASGLNSLIYPASIDPSVTINSSSGFMTGNNDSNISFPTNQVNRSALTGGSVTSWGTTSSANTARWNAAVTAYNGFLYLTGGQTAGTTGSDLNDVQYAPINSNGTLGAWHYTHNSTDDATTFVAGFPTAVSAHGSFAYNGYLYVVAGSNNTGNPVSTVQFAPINSNGTVGTWSTTASLISAPTTITAFAYEDYAYALVNPGVEYAPINADGTLGSWHYTHNSTDDGTTFVSGVASAGAQAVNGFIYSIRSSSTTVDYAPINANGTVGTWVSTSTMPTTLAGAETAACGGYFYALSSSAYYYVDLQASGAFGTWASTTPLQTAKTNSAEACYNGYLYDVAGYTGSQVASVTVQFAKVDPAGATKAFATTTSFNSSATEQGSNVGRTYHVTIAYQGFLYVIGGQGKNAIGNSAALASTESAPINSDGTVGTWTMQTALPSARYGMAAVIYSGTLYILGGYTGSSFLTDVLSTPLGNSGSISSWTTNTAFITGRTFLGAATYNGYLYILGGCTAFDGFGSCTTVKNDVQFSSLSSGSPGVWHYTHNSVDDGTTFVAGFTTARDQLAAVAYGGYIYVIGGETGGATGMIGSVYYAPINTNGTIGSWAATSSLVRPRQAFAGAVASGCFYALGGYEFTGSGTQLGNDVEYTCQNSDGSLGGWTLKDSTLTTLGSGWAGAAYKGNIYITGLTGANTVQFAAISNGGSGNAGSWSATSSFSTPRSNHTSIAYNGYVYVIGGTNSSGSALSDVQFARFGNNGSLINTLSSCPGGGTLTAGTWCTTSSLPLTVTNHAVATYNGYLYILGGSAGGTISNEVLFAKINSDGSLGAWHYTHNSTDDGTTFVAGFTTARENHGAAAFNGYLYVIGGSTSGFGSTVNSVQYAPLNTNGTVGTWAATSSLTTARSDMAAVVNNGYLYVVGGADTNGNVLGSIEYASLSGTGAAGTWRAVSIPDIDLQDESAAVYDGYLYVAGGYSGSSGYVSGVMYAPLLSGGGIGDWTSTTSLAATRANGAAVANDGYLYVLGGCTNTQPIACNTFYNDVQYTPLVSITRLGTYSKLLDLGGIGSITSISYNGVLPTGGASISYRTAKGDALMSYSVTGSDLNSGTATGCVNVGRYVWVTVSLDDSLNAVFPDSSGANNANLTSFTINYNTNVHPAPSQRLRGGKFFSSNVLQPLDLCTP